MDRAANHPFFYFGGNFPAIDSVSENFLIFTLGVCFCIGGDGLSLRISKLGIFSTQSAHCPFNPDHYVWDGNYIEFKGFHASSFHA